LGKPFPVALGVGALAAVALVAGYSWSALARFDRVEASRGTILYAAPQPLVPGLNVRLAALGDTLARLRYTETRDGPARPGQFRRGSGSWEIFLRGDPPATAPQLIRVELRGDRVARVTRGGRDVGAASLEPEILTSAADRVGEDHRPVRLADVPFSLIDAVLAAEDHRFFAHHGLDLRGVARAIQANLRAGRVTQGGSTITQQLVKNRLLGRQRTFLRKIREAWLSTLVEWRYPKERILEAYLNEVYLGQRGALAIRGMSAGARAWFGKELHQLSLGEAALLAGMIRAPNSYSPAVTADRARERRDVVLARMRDLGVIGERDLQTARAEPIRVPSSTAAGQPAPYFTDWIRQELEQRFGAEALAGDLGARVHTTVDLTLQRFAENAVARGLDRLETRVRRLRRPRTERLQAALLALDPATGQIRALVGGRDYGASQFNRATHARRQPGSAFKPFVFATALAARGGRPAFTAASLLEDSPITLVARTGDWSPRNYEDRYEGRVTLRRALELSLNTATVRLADQVGLDRIVATARSAGITSRLAPVPALALGAFEVTPLELAGAYLPFANGGQRDTPSGVRAVIDGDGDAVEPERADRVPVLSPAEAYVMTSLLRGVIETGTATEARRFDLPLPIAGKTGTTNDGRDAWFVGYSPTLLTLVWVGFDSGEAHGLSGAEAALPIWADFMKQALETYPAADFAVPPGVVLADIDATNGKLAGRFCPVTRREVFLDGSEPGPCDEHGTVADLFVDWWKRFRGWLGR
jgi:penicillin-binding protein 1B